jgi:putative phage-type endonuclease
MTPAVMDRTTFIGGSDIAKVMGMSRYGTPLSIWGEKVGRIIPEDISDKWQIRCGKRLEDAVADFFTEETGLKVRRAPQEYTHKEYEFMRCQVDRLITGTDELLECKTCAPWKKSEWAGEEIPQEYILQVMWQLMITGRKVGWIAVLIGNEDFKYKKIEADQELFDQMTDAAIKFWKMVQDEVPPMAIADDNESIVEIYPKHNEQIQQIDEFNAKIAHLQELKMHIAELENQQAGIEAEIKQVIGESVGFKTTDYTVLWKVQMTKRLDTKDFKLCEPQTYEKFCKESMSRVLRISKNKNKE